MTTWQGREVTIVNDDPDTPPMPADVDVNLRHVLMLQRKIERLTTAREDSVEALAASVQRWNPNPSKDAEAVCRLLTDNQVPGRGAVSGIVGVGKSRENSIKFCVYVLTLDSEIVYVGRSKGKQRARFNKHAKTKVFDAVLLYACSDESHMRDLESVLIKQHNPHYNLKSEPRTGFGS